MPNRPFTQTLMPHLSVRSVEESYRYYTNVLGFLPGMTFPGPDGKLGHAEVTLGSVHLMFGPYQMGSSNPTIAKTAFAENTKKGVFGGISLYLNLGFASVDNYYKSVREKGAKILQEPENMFWGDRIFSLQDPDGYVLSFAETVAEFDPTKAPK